MSSDPEQDYFSDGLTEEIINALAQVPGLKVIARTSSFAFKGKHIDIRDIARTLDVTTIRPAGSIPFTPQRMFAQWPGLEPFVNLVVTAVDGVEAGSYIEVEIPVS